MAGGWAPPAARGFGPRLTTRTRAPGQGRRPHPAAAQPRSSPSVAPAPPSAGRAGKAEGAQDKKVKRRRPPGAKSCARGRRGGPAEPAPERGARRGRGDPAREQEGGAAAHLHGALQAPPAWALAVNRRHRPRGSALPGPLRKPLTSDRPPRSSESCPLSTVFSLSILGAPRGSGPFAPSGRRLCAAFAAALPGAGPAPPRLPGRQSRRTPPAPATWPAQARCPPRLPPRQSRRAPPRRCHLAGPGPMPSHASHPANQARPAPHLPSGRRRPRMPRARMGPRRRDARGQLGGPGV